MSGVKKVFIFGNSLSLAGIGACLKLENNMEVNCVDPHDSCILEHLEEFAPQAIIFDLHNLPIDLDMDLLRRRPGLLMIGVDPSSDEVFVLKGQRRKVVTTGELTQLITEQTTDIRVKKRQ